MKKRSVVTAITGVAVFATAAFAAVSFSPTNGGFAGKGDVQTLFGLNNKEIQKDIDELGRSTAFLFSYESSATFEAVCAWTTGEGTRGEKKHDITLKRKASIVSDIDGSARKTGQWTGFILTVTDTDTQGSAPVVGEPCVGGDGIAQNGTWESVVETGSTGGELLVTRARTGQTEELPITELLP